jgi:uncharacterized membrane protein
MLDIKIVGVVILLVVLPISIYLSIRNAVVSEIATNAIKADRSNVILTTRLIDDSNELEEFNKTVTTIKYCTVCDVNYTIKGLK